jgi:uncharacterized protein
MGLDEIMAAAKSGAVDAYYDLGMMFSAGDGVDVDLIEAHKWFNLAVMGGFEDAKGYRADIAAELSPGDVAAAQRKAREWLSSTSDTHH